MWTINCPNPFHHCQVWLEAQLPLDPFSMGVTGQGEKGSKCPLVVLLTV